MMRRLVQQKTYRAVIIHECMREYMRIYETYQQSAGKNVASLQGEGHGEH